VNVPNIPKQVQSALRESRHTVILTGSGVSAESGIPTFRDRVDGLWGRYRPEDLASAEAFERNPDLVWQWYQWRRDLISRARPNAAHLAIAALERILPRLTLVTQNVDGLHQQAGSSAVHEFHGNINRNRCSVEQRVLDIMVLGTTKPPRCPTCGARVRPDVVWFGEAIAAHMAMAASIAVRDCDLFLAVGTSAIVRPAAGLIENAHQAGAQVVEINIESTPVSGQMDFCLLGSAGLILPGLVSALS
jgi:NAD-dependent deacetylase